MADEGTEGGVGEEGAVDRICVGEIEEGIHRGFRKATNALVRGGIGGRVEDAVSWTGFGI